MKSYTRTPQSGDFRAPFGALSFVVCAVALLGCSPGSAINPVEASSATIESRVAEIVAKESDDAGLPLAETPRELLEWIAHGEFERRDQVATGRFLHDFERLSSLVDNMDREQLQAVSWGVRSSRLRAPVRNALDRSPAGTAELRLVKHEGGWKLENVTVNRTPRIVRDGNDSQTNN